MAAGHVPAIAMRKPTATDYAVGNPLFGLVALAVTVGFGLEYWNGAQDRVLFLLIGGFMVLWANAARSRVAAYKAHTQEWEQLTGEPYGKGRRLGQGKSFLDLFFNLIRFIVLCGLLAATSPFWLDWALRFVRELGIAPKDFGTVLPSLPSLPQLPSFPNAPSLPRLPNFQTVGLPSIDTVQQWAAAHSGALLIAAATGTAVFYLWRLTRAWRSFRKPARVAARQKWDGTVQIMLRVPE